MQTDSLISVSEFKDWQDNVKTSPFKILKVLYKNAHNGPAKLPEISLRHPNTFIPNAIGFDFQTQFADVTSLISNTMCSHTQFSQECDSLGIENSDTLVIYDDFGNFCASRVWFMFKAMGHKHVKILDGGLPAYLHAALPTINTLAQPKAKHSPCYQVRPNQNFEFVDANYVLDNLATQTSLVVDARSNKRFMGFGAEAKPELRAGHIPKSVNVHYSSLQDECGRFLSKAALARAFSDFPEKLMIFSCGSGVTACILAQAADLLGHRNLKVYDGSWSEWGACMHFPIEKAQNEP